MLAKYRHVDGILGTAGCQHATLALFKSRSGLFMSEMKPQDTCRLWQSWKGRVKKKKKKKSPHSVLFGEFLSAAGSCLFMMVYSSGCQWWCTPTALSHEKTVCHLLNVLIFEGILKWLLFLSMKVHHTLLSTNSETLWWSQHYYLQQKMFSPVWWLVGIAKNYWMDFN